MNSVDPIAQGDGLAPIPLPRPSAPAARRLRSSWRILRQNPLALFGTIIVVFFILIAVFGPLMAPYSPVDPIPDQRQQPPSLAHLFGTDNLSRDVFSRVIIGSRDIISVAGFGTFLAVAIGTTLGLIVGYQGGWLDDAFMRLFDSLLALPATLLALLLVGAVGPSRESILIVIVIVYIPIVARVVRSVVLDVKTKGFVEAAQTRGENYLYILTRELLPSVLPALVVEASLRFAYAIFLVATLGFLGIGVQPPSPDWGLQVAQAKDYGSSAWWMLFFPCAAIATLIIGVNLMSDGLRQILQTGASREQE
ncbi:MAG: ABC transporter permease [Aggregatilineales bacterium]